VPQVPYASDYGPNRYNIDPNRLTGGREWQERVNVPGVTSPGLLAGRG
jgi:hypothetical protein